MNHVLLIHGLLNGNYWLWKLSARLRDAGFAPEIFSYSSLIEGPQHAVPKLIETLRNEPFDALVGHSLGGLIALQALRQAPDIAVSRVVCMGSPLRGSAIAQRLAQQAWSRPVLGRSADLLCKGLDEWRGTAQVGMIAGDMNRGMGRLFVHFDGISDGTVAINETRFPGLADHCIVHSSHSGLVFSAEAAAQVVHFLREGKFNQTQSDR
jgi:pimeloyl-ACP methyl ester carboxylesterase